MLSFIELALKQRTIEVYDQRRIRRAVRFCAYGRVAKQSVTVSGPAVSK